MRTVFTFNSSAFNTTAPKDHFINPCCFGDDAAEWMIARLRARGVECQEPDQEDFGWFFRFSVGGATHLLVLGHERESDGKWICQIERSRGFVSWLFGRRNAGVTPAAVAAVHEALSGRPEIGNLLWHEPSRFDQGDEDHGTPTPET